MVSKTFVNLLDWQRINKARNGYHLFVCSGKEARRVRKNVIYLVIGYEVRGGSESKR